MQLCRTSGWRSRWPCQTWRWILWQRKTCQLWMPIVDRESYQSRRQIGVIRSIVLSSTLQLRITLIRLFVFPSHQPARNCGIVARRTCAKCVWRIWSVRRRWCSLLQTLTVDHQIRTCKHLGAGNSRKILDKISALYSSWRALTLNRSETVSSASLRFSTTSLAWSINWRAVEIKYFPILKSYVTFK